MEVLYGGWTVVTDEKRSLILGLGIGAVDRSLSALDGGCSRCIVDSFRET